MTDTCLMRRLMAEAQARAVPVWLSVYRINAARRLYARLGFAEHPRDEVRVFMVWPAHTALPPPGQVSVNDHYYSRSRNGNGV